MGPGNLKRLYVAQTSFKVTSRNCISEKEEAEEEEEEEQQQQQQQ